MLADLKLAFGPWTVVFEGALFNYKTSLISNNNSIILIAISQENSPKVILSSALILESKKNLVLFAEHLEHETTCLSIKSKENIFNYLITGLQPVLVDVSNLEEQANALIEKCVALSGL